MTEATIVETAPVEAAPAAQAEPVQQPAQAPQAEPQESAEPTSWIPPDWRERLAGQLPETASDDERTEHTKLLADLKRLNSPADMAKKLREQNKYISSGDLKKALPKNATEAQIAEYRKANGIPDAADKYGLSVPKDMTPSPVDEVMLASFAEHALRTNQTPEQAKAAADAYFEARQVAHERVMEANITARDEAVEVLRSEMGPDYKPAKDGVMAMLQSQDAEAMRHIVEAVGPDGVQLLNRPEVMRMLMGQARTLGFVGSAVVPAGGDLGMSIDAEIEKINATMFNIDGTKNPAYWQSQKTIDRMSQLLQARDKVKR